MSELDEMFKSLMGEEKKEPSFSLTDILVMVKEFAAYLWMKKWIVVIAGFSFAAIGLIYACIRTIQYTANYEFTIEGDSGGRTLSLATLLGGSGTMGTFSGDNLVQLMRSSAMVQRTLLKPVAHEGDTINFMEYFLICDSVRAKCEKISDEDKDTSVVSICDIEFPLKQDRSSFTRNQDSILMAVAGAIAQNMAVEKVDKKLSFVTCSYTYTDEEFCKRFLDAYIEEVISFYLETKMMRSERNIVNFQRQADSLKMEVMKSISARAAYADENINPAKQSVGVGLRKIEMDIQINSTAYQELMKSIAALKIEQMREVPLIQIVNEPHYPLANNKARKLKFIIIGGLLGGFFSVFGLFALYYYQKNIKPALSNLPANVESED